MVFAAVVLILSTFSFSAQATGNQPTKEVQQLAKYFGDIQEIKSNKITTVIVELEEPSMLEAKEKGKKQTKNKLKKARDVVKAEVGKKAKSGKVNREYDHVFSGFSLDVKGSEIPNLLTIPGVKAVYPNVEYTATTLEEIVIEKDAYSPEMMHSAPFIGSDTAWEMGYTGEGVTVAIIDTGVDYTHPDLAHAFGDYKGWDFVDNDNDPQETPVGDPRGASTLHGTHVAGTVAANGLIKGVAPDATLLAYRVLGPGGSGSTENVVASIERAVLDGADVMNLSLGNSLNNADWATSIALDHAMADGVVAVTSNGNAGPNNWTVGSPGTSREAISVGATMLPYNVYNAQTISSDEVSYSSSQVQGFPSDEALLALSGNKYHLVDVGFGAPADFAGKDLTGKIALISRGAGIAFVDKAAEAAKAGAEGAIIYNNTTGVMPIIPGMAVPTIMLTQADGQALLAKVNDVTVTFNIEFAGLVGETIADFSSRGPVVDTWMIKPDVSAPGVNITSTIPTHNSEDPHGYAALQGTSMASPHVAGAAAVLLQANPGWGVYDVKAALMNTSEKLINPSTGKVYPHNTQGAGSIRVVDALEAKSLVTPGSYSFGYFEKKAGLQVERQQFSIKNITKKAQKYSVKFELNREVSSDLRVVTSSSVKVNPGATQAVNVSVSINTQNMAAGYYEGNLVITSDSGEVTNVPTILFVDEPDYPPLTDLGISELGTNEFEVYAYLPGGADAFEMWLFQSNSAGAVGGYIGDGILETNVTEKGFVYRNWDGTNVTTGQKLAPGYYRVAIFASKNGRTAAYLAEELVQIR